MVSAYLGASAIIIGTIGPWATTALESIAGTKTDGTWTLFAGVLALVLLMARRVVLFNILIGLAVGAEAIHRITKVNGYSVEAFGQTVHPASVGWGLWVMVIGCVALIVGSWFFTDEVKTQRNEKRIDPDLDASG
jgi:predicted membrane channel-forming protein YqfA (hemolysin III family)